MSKPKGQIIGQWVGISASVVLAGVGMIALRHALETPQPLKSLLPGEAHLYRWQKRSIFYKVAGAMDAPPLVLLHTPQIGGSGYEMQHIMSPLAETYRVYALDLLGFGLSDRPGTDYSPELYSAFCQDFLREVVGSPATLVASGLSCNYAISAAAEAPDLCASLVLISPVALQGDAQPSQLKQLAEKQPLKALLYPLLSTHLAFLLTHQGQRARSEDFAQFYANTHQLGAEHAAMALLAGKLTKNTEEVFEKLRQPVLMIWGTHALDNQAIVANLHKTTTLLNPARQVRKVELIQEAALAVHQEQPEGVITALKRWREEGFPRALHDRSARPTAQPEQAQASQTTAASRSDNAAISAKEAATPTTVAPDNRSEVTATVPINTVSASTVATSPNGQREKSGTNERGETSNSSNGDRQSAEGELVILAYCVKCKQKRKMLQAHRIVMKNGRPATRGICPVCGTRLNRIGGGN